MGGLKAHTRELASSFIKMSDLPTRFPGELPKVSPFLNANFLLNIHLPYSFLWLFILSIALSFVPDPVPYLF